MNRRLRYVLAGLPVLTATAVLGTVSLGQTSSAATEPTTLVARCGEVPSGATDRACARAALPVVARELLSADSVEPLDSPRFHKFFLQFNEALNRSLGPSDDPQQLASQVLRRGAATLGRSSARVQERGSIRRLKQTATGTCTLNVGVTRNGDNRPTGVSASQCTIPSAISASGISVVLNRYSGGWYEDNSASVVVPGGIAQVLAPSRSMCGSYYSSGFVRWAPAPGWTVTPNSAAGTSRVTSYC